MTEPRLEIPKVWPEGYRTMLLLEGTIRKSGLDLTLYELIKIRASQINGCAFCIDMHTKDARAAGETEQRIYALSAWRETPFFTEQERAALALTESITLLTEGHVPDEVYAEAAKHFDEETLSKVIMAGVVINMWNRIALSQRTPVGDYQPPAHAHA